MENESQQELQRRAFDLRVGESGFYAEPQRVQCLNFLLHLAPYSDGLLLVTGEQGSGKSTLLHQFIAKGGDNWRFCLLDARQLESLSVMLRELQQEFGFGLQGATDRLAKVNGFVEHLQGMQDRGFRPILIIDEAHALEEDVTAFLAAVLETIASQKGCLSLVIVGEEKLETLPWFESMKRFGLHSFALTPLDSNEAERYIRHHLQLAGLAADSLSSSQVKKIIKQSRGNLGGINQLARTFINPEAPQLTQSKNIDSEVQRDMTTQVKQAKKPIKFSRILFGILTVALVLVLFFEDEINSFIAPQSSNVDEQRQMDDASKHIDIVKPPQIFIPDVAEEPEPVVEDIAVTEAKDEPTEADVAAVPEDIELEPEEKPVVVEQKTEKVIVEEHKPQASVPPKSQQAEQEVVVEETKKEEVISTQAPKVEPEQVVVKTNKVAEEVKAPTDQGLIKRESWILAQNPEHFILQIMSFSQEMRIAKTLEDISAKDKFSYYKYHKDGKVWYRLTYGVYPDRKSAKDAVAKGLPKQLGKVKPWIRRLGDVQKEIAAQN